MMNVVNFQASCGSPWQARRVMKKGKEKFIRRTVSHYSYFSFTILKLSQMNCCKELRKMNPMLSYLQIVIVCIPTGKRII